MSVCLSVGVYAPVCVCALPPLTRMGAYDMRMSFIRLRVFVHFTAVLT
jgi:hypothetical protein